MPWQEKGSPEGDVAVDEQLDRKCSVVLYNDEDHTYQYVVEMLTKVCKLTKEQAFRCAVEVDLTGKTVVFTGDREKCQLMSSRINSYGPDPRLMRSMGSMSSEVQ